MPAPTIVPEESPYKILSRTAPLLISRAFLVAAIQFFAKRVIYAQADESLLAAYGIFSVIDGLIFIVVFRGLRIISFNAATLHAEEIKQQSDIENQAGAVAFDPLKMGVLYRQGVFFGCLLMIPAALLCALTPTFLRWMKQPEIVLQNSADYFFYSFFGYFADMLYRSRARIDIGRSEPRFALYGDITESLIDAVGTAILVNGKYGFPKMGVNGGAMAYTVAAIITAIGYNFRSYINPCFEKYQFYHFSLHEFKHTFYSPEFKKILSRGMYIAFKFLIIYTTLALTTFLCGLSGTGALVGLQAAGVYNYLVSLPLGGGAEAVGAIVARLFKNNWLDARKIGNYAILTGCLFTSICAGLLCIFINPIAQIFVSNDAAHEKDFYIVKTFLRIQAVMEIIDSINNMGASVLSGCSKMRYSFLLSVAFIFALNSTLTAIAHFIFHQDAPTIYAVQLIGLLFNSMGILIGWKQQKPPQENNANTTLQNASPWSSLFKAKHSFWQVPQIQSPIIQLRNTSPQIESPRHVTINELLPTQ